MLIMSMETERGTNIGAGMKQGLDELSRARTLPSSSSSTSSISSGDSASPTSDTDPTRAQSRNQQPPRMPTDPDGAGPPLKALFLLTDGKPTKGITDREEVVREVLHRLKKRGQHPAIFTFGFGELP